jgi:nitrogen regulatory protein P-II 2
VHLTEMRLVTVIAADDLEDRLIRELTALGASGYTVLPARGAGSHGVRTSALEGSNVQIEAIVDLPTADRIVERMLDQFQPRHALVVYVSAIHVVRAGKFTTAPPAAP